MTTPTEPDRPPSHFFPVLTPTESRHDVRHRLVILMDLTREYLPPGAHLQTGRAHALYGTAQFDGVILDQGRLHRVQIHLEESGSTQRRVTTLTRFVEDEPYVRFQPPHGPPMAMPFAFHVRQDADGRLQLRKNDAAADDHGPFTYALNGDGQPDWARPGRPRAPRPSAPPALPAGPLLLTLVVLVALALLLIF